MPFTNENLRRVKDGLAGQDDVWFDGYSVGTIRALIARLEAAEKVCEASAKVVRPRERIGNAPLERAIFNALEAWRKTAGKDAK